MTLLHDTVHTNISVYDCELRRLEIVATFRVVVFSTLFCSLCHTPDIPVVHVHSHSTWKNWPGTCAHAYCPRLSGCLYGLTYDLSLHALKCPH